MPALIALAVEERVALAVLGPGSSVQPSLAALSPGLLAAYAVFFLLGFALYALIYAAAGSLVSRAEDLQMIALPMSLVAIAGYLVAVLALSGTTSTMRAPWPSADSSTAARATAAATCSASGFSAGKSQASEPTRPIRSRARRSSGWKITRLS